MMADHRLVIVLQQIMSLVGLLSHYLLRLLTDYLFVLLVVPGAAFMRMLAPYGPGMFTTVFLQIYPVSLDSVFTEILRNRIDRNRNGFTRFGLVGTGPKCLAQGHINNQLGGAGARITNLPVTRQLLSLLS